MRTPRLSASVLVVAVSILLLASSQKTIFSPGTSRQFSYQPPQLYSAYSEKVYTSYARPQAPYQSRVPASPGGNRIIAGTGYPAAQYPTFTSQGDPGTPEFEFLNPKGLKLTVNYQEPYPRSSVREVKLHVSVNKPLAGGKHGDYEASLALGDHAWSHTFPDIRLQQGDTLYSLVELLGLEEKQILTYDKIPGLERKTWWKYYTRIYPVNDQNPHGGNSYLSQNEIESPAPQGPSTGQRPSEYFGSGPSGPQAPFGSARPELSISDIIGEVLRPANSQETRPSQKPTGNFYPSPPQPQNPYPPYGRPSQPQGPRPPSAKPPDNFRPSRPSPGVQVSYETYPTPAPDIIYPQRPSPPIVSRPSPPKPPPKTGAQCRLSSTTYNNGKRACAGVVFVEKFNFEQQSQITGPDDDESFTVFLKSQSVLKPDGSIQSIEAKELETYFGEGKKDDYIELKDCTSKIYKYCSLRASGHQILPPVVSGRVTTDNTLHFKYGVLEVTAKLPVGDWIVPELWLMPRTRHYGDHASGKIILARARGNRRLTRMGQDYDNRVLEMGVELQQYKDLRINDGVSPDHIFRSESTTPWNADYHTYKLIWTPDKLTFLVDGKEVGTIDAEKQAINPNLPGTNLAPFDQEFYLVFGVHVAGDKDFTDMSGKPWKDFDPKKRLHFWEARDQWMPTWTDPVLRVSRIRLRALDY